jgi:hypothetical protein
MKLLCAIRSVLSILAVVGLAVAPVARPAMGMPAIIQADIASDHVAMAMPEEAMPEDMPCCPKKAPIPDCGNAVQGAGLVMPHGPANVLPFGNDTALVGLGQSPPLRPPKI